MAFTKKVNTRNIPAVIKDVTQMLEAGFPKKETYVVVGEKYNLSYKTVQRIMNGQILDTSGHISYTNVPPLDNNGQVLKSALDVTSADIVDGIIKKFGKKGDDYIAAFERAPKDKDGAIVMNNGTKLYF